MAERSGSYRDLLVWQQAMDLAVAIYSATNSWPGEEQFGLTSQVSPAAVSVPSNIAEGYGKELRGSYQQFLRVAQGSLKELETQLMLAERVGIAPASAIQPLLERTESVGKLLRLLIRKLSAG